MNYWTLRHRHRAGLLDCHGIQPFCASSNTRQLWRCLLDRNAKAETIVASVVATIGGVVWSVDFNQTVAPIGTFVQDTDLVGQAIPIDEELVPQHLDLEDRLFLRHWKHLKFLALHDALRRFLNFFQRHFRLEKTLEFGNRFEVPPEDPSVELADLHIELVACSVDRTFHVRSLSGSLDDAARDLKREFARILTSQEV